MNRYIDADELYSRIKAKTNPYGKPSIDWESGVKVLDMIKKAPTADVVEVRHGEWIFDFTLNGDDFYKCSICGRQEVLNGLCNERNIATHLPYCHCGAKMDGERREE